MLQNSALQIITYYYNYTGKEIEGKVSIKAFSSVGNNGLHQQYNVEEIHNVNRMAMIAAAGSLAGDTSTAAAVQAAAANLAAAMRMGVSQVYRFSNTPKLLLGKKIF